MNHARRFTYTLLKIICVFAYSFHMKIEWMKGWKKRMKQARKKHENNKHKMISSVWGIQYIGICFHIFGFGDCCCCFLFSILLNKILNFYLKAGSIGLLLRAVRRAKNILYFECSFVFICSRYHLYIFWRLSACVQWIRFL